MNKIRGLQPLETGKMKEHKARVFVRYSLVENHTEK